MKYIISLLTMSLFLSAADFQALSKQNIYQKIDKEFTLPCDCGEPAKLYPYRGEDIPFTKTMPCPVNGCPS
jgi:hypothetical protein